MTPITYDDLLDTWNRIKPYVHRTPVMTCGELNMRAGCEIFLKCENFQRAGSFKIRGASHFLSRLSHDELRRGVVCHSSGNHAQAVALAARLFETTAHVVMPENCVPVKKAATEAYGGKVTLCEPTMSGRDKAAQRIMDETGATLIHPYDHDYTIMGQSTAALELMDEVPDLDLIIGPVGGGGLISGTSLAAAGSGRRPRVVGCEPALADDAFQSFVANKLIPKEGQPTVADGLRAVICERTFDIIRKYVDDIVVASEEQIREAMLFLWERAKLVVEPSGATSLVPVLFYPGRLEAKRVGVILTGGNLDVRALLG